MLSIIIPTLNEKKFLPLLLDSIKVQDFSDYEIIVADAASTDGTADIARQYGGIVVEGGLPAKARNNGAKAAAGDTLFFLDADTSLPAHFLSASVQEFTARNLVVASFRLIPHPKNRFEAFLLDVSYNRMIVILEHILPHGAMAIMIKKDLFEKLGGYDESITLSEDHDLVRRAAKLGKFGIIRAVNLPMSTRRFAKDGWLATAIKFFLCELHMVFLGPVRSDIFKYKFNHYKSDK